MKTGAQLSAALHSRQKVYGTMLAFCRSPRWAKILKGLDFDYVIVDTEHSPIGRSEVADMVMMLERWEVVPIIRVYKPDPFLVTMALDAGAHGVLVPYCETVQEVRDVIAAARYRPMKGALARQVMEGGRFSGNQVEGYLKNFNANSVVIIGIESVPAVENLESILAVEGIDAIFIGPHDLSVSLGIPEQYDHPDFQAAVRRIIQTSARHGIAAGGHWMTPEHVTRWMAEGSTFILYNYDARAMQEGYRQGLSIIRNFKSENEAGPSPAAPKDWL